MSEHDIPQIDWINTPHTVAAEFERLRARLTAVEAERDEIAESYRALRVGLTTSGEAVRELKARLAAAIEAGNIASRTAGQEAERAEVAEAKLADVRAAVGGDIPADISEPAEFSWCAHTQVDDGGECYACGWVLPIEELAAGGGDIPPAPPPAETLAEQITRHQHEERPLHQPTTEPAEVWRCMDRGHAECHRDERGNMLIHHPTGVGCRCGGTNR